MDSYDNDWLFLDDDLFLVCVIWDDFDEEEIEEETCHVDPV
jgi:hypothetical protein